MTVKRNISIIVFPGSNCDRDLKIAIEKCMGIKPDLVWHKTSHIKKTDMIFLPGGFSFGDYLRAGTIATKSPAIKEVLRLSKKKIPIVGICNGFQILTECKLLDGALTKNKEELFKCERISLKLINTNNIFTKKLKLNSILNFPIAHSQGNYYIGENDLKKLEDHEQIVLKYSSLTGEINENSNPNGSVANIAGVMNREKNILGLMPHPERAIEKDYYDDGVSFFKSIQEIM